MKSKLENQIREAFFQSSQMLLSDNALFLAKRLLEINSKDEVIHNLIPFLFQQREYHYLISKLKYKKSILSRYYYSMCLLEIKDFDRAKRNFLILIDQCTAQEKKSEKIKKVKSSCYFSLGKIFEIQQKFLEAQKYYYKAYEENKSLFVAFVKFHELINKNELIKLQHKKINVLKFTKKDQGIMDLANKKDHELVDNDMNQVVRLKIKKPEKVRKKQNQEMNLGKFLKQLEKPLKLQKQCFYQKSILAFNLMKKEYRNTSFVHNRIAQSFMKLVKYKEAYQHFKVARKGDKLMLEDVEYYSSCLWHLNKRKELIELSEQFFINYPHSSQTWIVMGNTYSFLKEHASAIKFFKRALQINPNSSYVYCLLGHEFIFGEDFEMAKKSYQKAIQINCTEFYGYWGMGNVYLKMDKSESAIRFFAMAKMLNEKCPIIYTYLGLAHLNLFNYEDALSFFEKAEQLNPLSLMNKYYKATALFKLNQLDQALVELEFLKKQKLLESKIFLLIGKIYEKKGFIEKAHSNYINALELDPKDTQKIRNSIDLLNNREQQEFKIEKENLRTFQSYQISLIQSFIHFF